MTQAADWRSGPRWGVKSVLCPVHPLPLRGVPLKGKREVWRGKTESHIFHVPFRSFPLWWRAPYGQAPLGLEGSGAFRRPGSIVRVLRTERWVRPTERAGSEGSFICRCLGQRKPLQPPCGRGNAFPLWWLAPPPFPRSSVGRQKESALMGRLGALLRPTWRSYAGPPQGTIKLRYAMSCL